MYTPFVITPPWASSGVPLPLLPGHRPSPAGVEIGQAAPAVEPSVLSPTITPVSGNPQFFGILALVPPAEGYNGSMGYPYDPYIGAWYDPTIGAAGPIKPPYTG